jgi:hypothetical protein
MLFNATANLGEQQHAANQNKNRSIGVERFLNYLKSN